MIKIAIFASGNGSNAQALIDKAQELNGKLQIVGVISDHSNANVLNRAKSKGIEAIAIERNGNRDEHEFEILQQLSSWKPDWILLAGYMKILSSRFISKYPNRIINIHPSKLPDFPGLHAYEKSFESDSKSSAITIHYVDEGVDTGTHILQVDFPKNEFDTIDDFKNRGLELEHKLYQQILERIANDEL